MTDTSIEELERRYSLWQRIMSEPITGCESDANILMRDAIALLKEQEKECAALASWQCMFLDGSGLTADERGSMICNQAEENARLKAANEKLQQRHDRFIRESGTTLDACQCGRGKKPKYDMCEVCEREGEIRRLKAAIQRADCETPELIYIGRDYTVADLRKALGEDK